MERDLLSERMALRDCEAEPGPEADAAPSDARVSVAAACPSASAAGPRWVPVDRNGREAAADPGARPSEPSHARHVALIMDGNGRWAEARGLPRLEGHRQGVEALRAVVRAAPSLGVRYLTLYAFSTENWSRPLDEVAGLMDLLRRYLMSEADELMRERVRIRFIGDRSPLASDIVERMDFLERLTSQNSRLTVAMAVNYGARAELTAAVRRVAEAVASGRLAPDAVSEDHLSAALDTAELPDPDLVLRTSGEQRLSNFLLWQAAYAELMFTPEPWPDFTPELFARALNRFASRERRFGGLAQGLEARVPARARSESA
ncbi:MAG: polyprenyl diphosphate synthase [Pseudomonadota bacterium]